MSAQANATASPNRRQLRGTVVEADSEKAWTTADSGNSKTDDSLFIVDETEDRFLTFDALMSDDEVKQGVEKIVKELKKYEHKIVTLDEVSKQSLKLKITV